MARHAKLQGISKNVFYFCVLFNILFIFLTDSIGTAQGGVLKMTVALGPTSSPSSTTH